MLNLFSKKPIEAVDDPEFFYSSLLKRRLAYWKRHRDIRNKDVREEIGRLRFYNEKKNAYDFVRSQGIPCPQYQEYPSIAEAIKAHQDNPRFVIKPAAGHSSQGVYLLTREADGSLECHMTRKRFNDNDALIQEYEKKRKLAAKYTMSKEVIIEEYLEDAQGYEVPLDYKVYAFHSGVAMIMQKYGPLFVEKSKRIFNFYDAKGQLLGRIRDEPDGERDVLGPPASFKELMDASNKLVRAMNVSFIRIDLFLTPKGVYFGECTPLPNLGKKAFYDEYEAILGAHWMNSLKQMGLDYFQK